MKRFIKDPKSTCCKDEPGNGDSKPKDCLEKWKLEYKQVCDTYNIQSAETNKRKDAYDNSYGWEAKLRNWCQLIENTDGKVKAIITELNFLLEQVKTVCVKSKCTYEVLEKLSCLVKTIFDCLYTYDTNEEGLKVKISQLKELIKCLKDVGDKDKNDLIACIEAYEKKITAICEMQDAVLTKLLETLKCATLLWAYICAELGLEDKLEGMRDLLNGVFPEEKEEDCEPGEEVANTYPCDDKKAKPMPELPIKDETSTDSHPKGNTYYVKLKKDLKSAEEQTKLLKEQWVNSKITSDKTLAKKNSLGDAIKAAEALEKK